MGDKLMTCFVWTLAVCVVGLTLLSLVEWYTKPCDELKTSLIHKYSYAPMRCIK